MSQEKVNKYKEQKANRKEIIAKEKRAKKLSKIAWISAAIIIVVGIVAALGIEIHRWYVNDYLPSLPTYSAETLVISDLAGVLEEETEAEETEAETEAEETEAEAEETEAAEGEDNEVSAE